MNAPNVPYRPAPDRRRATGDVQRRRRSTRTARSRDVPVAGEHPLTLYVDKQELLTLMTLGGAPEALAIGYLRNQRLVHSIDDIVSVQVDWECNACAIKTRHGLADLEAKTAKRTKTTGCGQGTVFGDLMDEIDSVQAARGRDAHPGRALRPARPRARCTRRSTSRPAPCTAARSRPTTRSTSQILMFVEDVGRHNAVDAIAGRMWLDRLDGGDKIFYTTGRLTSEMVIKAAQMEHPVPGLALGADADGLRHRAEGRPHDDRPRDEQALPAVHRRRALRAMTRSRAPRRAVTAARSVSSPTFRRASSRTATAKAAAARTAPRS